MSLAENLSIFLNLVRVRFLEKEIEMEGQEHLLTRGLTTFHIRMARAKGW